MGKDLKKRVDYKIPYLIRVTTEIMEKASPNAIFLHCLPAHRGEEVSADVIDSLQSKVRD